MRLGTLVYIRRSNDVIPEILGKVTEERTARKSSLRRIVLPAALSWSMRGAHLFCPNRLGCRPQMIGRITHFASRDAMDIETFSDMTAEQLYQELDVRDPADLYTLQFDDSSSSIASARRRPKICSKHSRKANRAIWPPSSLPSAFRIRVKPRPRCWPTITAA